MSSAAIHSSSSGKTDPKINSADIDTVLCESDLKVSRAELNAHVFKAIDQRIASEKAANDAFIDSAKVPLEEKRKADKFGEGAERGRRG